MMFDKRSFPSQLWLLFRRIGRIDSMWKYKREARQNVLTSVRRSRSSYYTEVIIKLLTSPHSLDLCLIQTKAEFYAPELGIADFKASEDWLSKWKQCTSTTLRSMERLAMLIETSQMVGWKRCGLVWRLDTKQKAFSMLTKLDCYTILYKLTPNKT